MGAFMRRPPHGWAGCAVVVIAVVLLGVTGTRATDAGNSESPEVQELRRRAQGLDAQAAFQLASAYYNGRGIAKNDREAAVWVSRAAGLGHAAAQYNLALLYGKGEGVPKNEAEMVYWCRLAADRGYAQAQLSLASFYARGRGVNRDDVEAYKWLLLAGAQGNEVARRNYSVLERQLSAEERSESQRRAREYQPQPEGPQTTADLARASRH